jgi:hypothetical protein
MDERADFPRHPSPAAVAALRRQLAETYTFGAAVLERTARIADEVADREESRGRVEYATAERGEAAKARDAAARFRANARRLR